LPAAFIALSAALSALATAFVEALLAGASDFLHAARPSEATITSERAIVFFMSKPLNRIKQSRRFGEPLSPPISLQARDLSCSLRERNPRIALCFVGAIHLWTGILTDIKKSLYAFPMAASLDIFRALADPTRLRIFHLLRAMELAVGEIAQVVGQSQPRVSRHVRILVGAGRVDRRKEGSWVFLTPGEGDAAQAMLAWFDAVAPTREEALWI